MIVIGAIAVIAVVIIIAGLIVGSVVAVHAAPLVGNANEGGGEVVAFGRGAMAGLMVEGCGAAPEESFGIGEVGVFIEEILNEWGEVAMMKMGMESAECFCFLGGVVVIGCSDENSIEMADERVNLKSGYCVGVCAAKIVTVFTCKIDSAWSIDECAVVEWFAPRVEASSWGVGVIKGEDFFGAGDVGV